jgi:transcriptional regulator with XRE-family HTH domain
MPQSASATKRKTIGQSLATARERTGASVPVLVKKILDYYGRDIGESTVRDIEKDKTPNPGIKTIETIALGLGLDPLEVISLGLDSPPEMEPGFKASQFARLWKVYSRVSREKRPFADENIQSLIDKLDRWR